MTIRCLNLAKSRSSRSSCERYKCGLLRRTPKTSLILAVGLDCRERLSSTSASTSSYSRISCSHCSMSTSEGEQASCSRGDGWPVDDVTVSITPNSPGRRVDLLPKQQNITDGYCCLDLGFSPCRAPQQQAGRLARARRGGRARSRAGARTDRPRPPTQLHRHGHQHCLCFLSVCGCWPRLSKRASS